MTDIAHLRTIRPAGRKPRLQPTPPRCAARRRWHQHVRLVGTVGSMVSMGGAAIGRVAGREEKSRGQEEQRSAAVTFILRRERWRPPLERRGLGCWRRGARRGCRPLQGVRAADGRGDDPEHGRAACRQGAGNCRRCRCIRAFVRRCRSFAQFPRAPADLAGYAVAAALCRRAAKNC